MIRLVSFCVFIVCLSACVPPYYTTSKPGLDKAIARNHITSIGGVIIAMQSVEMEAVPYKEYPRKYMGVEYMISQNNGQIVKVAQPAGETLAVGDRVKVIRADAVTVVREGIPAFRLERMGYEPERDDFL